MTREGTAEVQEGVRGEEEAMLTMVGEMQRLVGEQEGEKDVEGVRDIMEEEMVEVMEDMVEGQGEEKEGTAVGQAGEMVEATEKEGGD